MFLIFSIYVYGQSKENSENYISLIVAFLCLLNIDVCSTLTAEKKVVFHTVVYFESCQISTMELSVNYFGLTIFAKYLY